MILALLLLVTGIVSSAFFSGAETGLYRVTRVRLVIEGLSGDKIARGLLWLTNHPSMFVATTLVGNNCANYLVSLAVVIGASRLFPGEAQFAELLGPILLSPLVFVLGESMPKTVFYAAPNRMLRRYGMPLLVTTLLFLPVTLLLWLISRSLEFAVGHSPQKLQLGLARRELQQVFQEGREVGILNPAQQALVQGLFTVANRPLSEFVIPATKMVSGSTKMTKQEVLRLARRHRIALLPIEDATDRRKIAGYLRVVDLCLEEGKELPPPWPAAELRASEPVLKAIAQMHQSNQSLGYVVDAQGKAIGFVTTRHLTKCLFGDR